MQPPEPSSAWKKSQEAEKGFWENQPERYSHFSKEYWLTELAKDDIDFSFFQDARIVEMGCGPFGMIHYIEGAKEKIGFDPLIDKYRELGLLQDGDVRHLTGKGEQIDIPDGTADIVISYNVLDHVEDPPAYIREAYRLLAPGGRLYLNCHAFKAWLSPILPLLRYIDKPHPWHFTEAQLHRYVRETGFSIKRTKNYPVIIGRDDIKARVGKLVAIHSTTFAEK